MGIETFFGNLLGISDTAGNERRDAKATAERQARELGSLASPSAAATPAEKARIRKKTKTILTSPLSGDEFYGSKAPTLLGSGDMTKKNVLG